MPVSTFEDQLFEHDTSKCSLLPAANIDSSTHKFTETVSIGFSDACNQSLSYNSIGIQSDLESLPTSNGTESGNLGLLSSLARMEVEMTNALFENFHQSHAFKSWKVRWDDEAFTADRSLIVNSVLSLEHDAFQKVLPVSVMEISRSVLIIGYGDGNVDAYSGRVAIWNSGIISRVDSRRPNVSVTFNSAISSLAFNQGSKCVAVGHFDGFISIIQLDEQLDTCMQLKSKQDKYFHFDEVTGFVWTNTGRLYSASSDGKIILWTIDAARKTITSTREFLPAGNSPITHFQFHSHQQVICGHTNGAMTLFDLDNDVVLISFISSLYPARPAHACTITGFALLNDSYFLSCSLDGTLKLWMDNRKDAISTYRPLASTARFLSMQAVKLNADFNAVVLAATDSSILIFVWNCIIKKLSKVTSIAGENVTSIALLQQSEPLLAIGMSSGRVRLEKISHGPGKTKYMKQI
eukprot:Partr_v1_DN28379_c1_g1_i6_m79353